MAVLCYRTERDIIPFIENLHRIMSMFSISWELVLVGNYWPGTSDETPGIVRELSNRLDHVRCIAEPKEGDMGWDMQMGLNACTGRYIGVIDGDGQFPVEAIFSCFAKIKSEDLDFVKTYRVMRSDGWYRNTLSAGYNILFQLLFPKYRAFRDANSKPKIIRRSAYEKMNLTSTDWFLDAELVLNALELNLRMYEIPIKFESLEGRPSFVKLSAVWEFTINLLRYRLRTLRSRRSS
jgi:glycosyltransferase involved in cell wall biosynthesis